MAKAKSLPSWISIRTCGFSSVTFPETRSCPGAWVWMPCGNSWDFSWDGAATRAAGAHWAAAEVKFSGQILPSATKVVYNINVKRVIERKLIMGIADGNLSVDGTEIYSAKDLRVGLFKSTESF